MPIGILSKKEDPIDLCGLIESVKSSLGDKGCGSIVTFTGIVRPRGAGDSQVDHLEYEVFEEAAKKSLSNMATALSLIEGVREVALCHKYGRFSPGEEVLYVVIATERSSTAFETLRLAVTRIKHELPIWKKECTEDGGCWMGVE